MTADNRLKQLESWLVQHVPADYDLLVPVSGGSDSALSFWLCNKALPGRVKGVFSGISLREKQWFEEQGPVMYLKPQASTNPEVERWAQFHMLALQERRILVGSRNRTEDCLGTYSLASRLAALLPIVGLWKQEVMELCRQVGVPQSVLASSLEADPECGRPAKLAAVPLGLVDVFVQVKTGDLANAELSRLSETQQDYLEQLYHRHAFKRNLPLRP